MTTGEGDLLGGRLLRRDAVISWSPGWRTLAATLSGILIFRLWTAAVFPLTEDEAYYSLWAQSLQFGYFDHPPVVAWMIRTGETLFGQSTLAIRVLPTVLSIALSLLALQLARELGAGDEPAIRVALYTQTLLIVAVGGFLATPDAPVILFWAITLVAAARAIRLSSSAWWLVAGLAAGMAALSKYSGLFLAPGLFLWLVMSRNRRAALATWGPWAGLVSASMLFSLNVGWNASHEWAAFAKHFGRVSPESFDPTHVPAFLASQLILLNPAVAVLAGMGAWRFFRGTGNRSNPDISLLLYSTMPFLVYLTLHGLHSKVQGHWLAPVYVSFAVIAAFEARTGSRTSVRRWIASAAAPIAAGAAVVALYLFLSPSSRSVGGPAGSLQGWTDFAAAVDARAVVEGAAWVGTVRYGTNAMLKVGGMLETPSLQIQERMRYPPNDGSWRAHADAVGLIVDLPRRFDLSDLEICFSSVTQLDDVSRPVRGKDGVLYRVVRVQGPKRDLLARGCWDGDPPSKLPKAEPLGQARQRAPFERARDGRRQQPAAHM